MFYEVWYRIIKQSIEREFQSSSGPTFHSVEVNIGLQHNKKHLTPRFSSLMLGKL